MPMKDGTGPRGFGLRDGKGPHKKHFSKSSGFGKSKGIKGVVGKVALTAAANVGMLVAGKVIERVSLNGQDNLKDMIDKGFDNYIEEKNEKDVIVVEAVKDNANKE